MDRATYEKIKSLDKLPSPNGVALELIRLVDDPSTTLDQVTRAVEADPAIASKLIKLVNSPLAGTTRTVASVSMAVTLLGWHTVRNLALGFSLLSTHRDGASRTFEFNRFWSESLARGVAARAMADLFKCCPADEAFTIALLSRIGQLALAVSFPKEYDQIIEESRTNPYAVISEAERMTFGIDHNALTAEMMTDWRLASLYCDAVRRQDDIIPAGFDDDSRSAKVARLLQFAVQMGRVLTCPDDLDTLAAPLSASARVLGLEEAAWKKVLDSLQQQWPGIAAIFSVKPRTPQPSQTSQAESACHHQRILLVDDDPAWLRLMCDCLRGAGYEVRLASHGLEALRLIHSEGFQLIVTDWAMPEMDGLSLCRAVRESEAAGLVYIIVVTDRTTEQSLARAFDAGADDFFAKSSDKEELLSRLKAGVRTLGYEAKLASQRRAIQKTNAELASLNQRLHEMATTDELTGLYNRREAMRRLHELWALADRHAQPLACMMIDIDHFKRCNDLHGHDGGDAVLRATARLLTRTVRLGDSVFRLGGEEFLVLCPASTAAMASVAAERLRLAIASNEYVFRDKSLNITISIGVAEKDDNTQSPDDLLNRADRALYQAKHQGRNRVCTAGTNHPCATAR